LSLFVGTPPDFGCNYDNASIWENNNIPTEEDVVYISGTNNNVIRIFASNTTSFSSLYLTNVDFIVVQNISVGSVNLDVDSSLILGRGVTLNIPAPYIFNLTKDDDVRKYVIRRTLPVKEGKEGKKPRTKAPKIQRLVTPVVLQRKRHRIAQKMKRRVKRREDAANYQKVLAKYAKERTAEKVARRHSSASGSEKHSISKSK